VQGSQRIRLIHAETKSKAASKGACAYLADLRASMWLQGAPISRYSAFLREKSLDRIDVNKMRLGR